MNVWWTRFRRVVASLMLAAVASLVLHGGAMAALHGQSPGEPCAGTVASHHGSHGHHHGAEAAHHDPGTPGHQHGSKADPCCTSACVAAIPTIGADLSPACLLAAAVRQLVNRTGEGLVPGSLSRPPRTPDIA